MVAKNRFQKRKFKFIVFILFLIFVSIFLLLDFKMRPVIKNISQSKAKMIASSVIDEAVLGDMQNNAEKYENITDIHRSPSGEVLSVSMNVCKVNSLKSEINVIIQKKLAQCREKVFHIPLGTLSGVEILNSQGPEIPLKISSCGSVTSDFKSDFLNSGINQTLHRIYLSICARISVVIPGDSCVAEICTDILVSETVIVGRTPGMCSGFQSQNVCASGIYK